MAGEKRTLSFGITGEFITQITREWFYSGEKSIGKIMEILKSSMTGTDTPEAQIERFAEDILIGRAALKGSTDEGTYHLETYDPGEEERLLTNTDIWRLPQLLKDSRRKCDRMQERFLIAMEHLSEREQREVRRELGEETEEDRLELNLYKYIDRMMDKEEHTTGDYGWLEPNGTFHEVEWGEHQKWADEYVEQNFPDQYEDILEAGDWLTERGWVLLHNPSQGTAFATGSLVRDMTKAQREFLYDYYTERDCKKEANEVWKE